MKVDIKSKLRRELEEPIESERQAVYLVVEIRKLLELADRKRKKEGLPKDHTYSALAFYCDWAVHPVMDWENGRRIVRQFDKYQEIVEAINNSVGDDPLPVTADMDFLTTFSATVKLSSFRQQLRDFLQSESLDPGIAEDDDRWASFLSHYTGVIEDCPMRCEGQNLTYTDEVVLRVIDRRPPGAGEWVLGIQWCWTSKITGAETVNTQFYY